MGNGSSCREEPKIEVHEVPKVVVELNDDNHLKDLPVHLKLPSTGSAEATNSELVSGDETGRGSASSLASMASRLSYRLEHFVLEDELLRGIPLRATLWGLGKLWLTSPIDLPEQAKKSLWERSRKVTKLDIFLSHTWHTRGWRKVLALLVQLGSYNFLAGWFFGVVLGIVLQATMEIPDFIAPAPAIWIGGPIGSFLGLLASPYMPHWAACWGKSREMCFFDAACINQADPDLMQRGVYGLSGFLAVASELRILWSPPYLSRLWCVFELAAFRKANPAGRIVLKPLFVETGLLIIIVGIYGLIIVDEWRFGDAGVSAVLVVLTMFPSYIWFHILRRLLNDQHHLVNELRTFDIETVHCRSAEDTEYIYAAIHSWYGSSKAFTDHVRGPLADELTNCLSRTDLPGAYWLMIATPFVTFNVARSWLYAEAPTSTLDMIVGHCLARCIGNSILNVLFVQFVFHVCRRFAASAGRLLDYGKTFLIWLYLSAVLMCMFAIGSMVLNQESLSLSISYTAVNAVLYCIVSTRSTWRKWFYSPSPCDRSEGTFEV
ncbi:unnamed protein product [Symbiodinium sp. CCMP2456]|nr:unnamed protein product [Symbiodinium sp. CCMP2456]